MHIITALAAGILIGWLASILIGTNSREGLIRNIAIAIAGAFAGNWLLTKMVETSGQGGFSFGATTASLLGAAMLLLLVNRLSRA